MTKDEALTIRNLLLKNSDYMVLPDSGKDSAEVRKYRQDLMDLPDQPNFPENIVWPTLN